MACVAVGVFVASGCAADDVAPAPVAGAANSTGLTNRDERVTAGTARGLADALEDAGLAVPNAVDTTTQECRSVDCTQSIVTDTLRIKSFPTTTLAQRYASSRGLPRAGAVVISFAPPLTDADRYRYRTEIQRLAK